MFKTYLLWIKISMFKTYLLWIKLSMFKTYWLSKDPITYVGNWLRKDPITYVGNWLRKDPIPKWRRRRRRRRRRANNTSFLSPGQSPSRAGNKYPVRGNPSLWSTVRCIEITWQDYIGWGHSSEINAMRYPCWDHLVDTTWLGNIGLRSFWWDHLAGISWLRSLGWDQLDGISV